MQHIAAAGKKTRRRGFLIGLGVGCRNETHHRRSEAHISSLFLFLGDDDAMMMMSRWGWGKPNTLWTE